MFSRPILGTSSLEQGITEGENPVFDQGIGCMWYIFQESVCLGMQTKMGGKYHLKLNIGERPIANKYREGKMKRTLKRELNSTWNCQKGNVWNQYCMQEFSCDLLQCPFLFTSQHQFDLEYKAKGRWPSGVIAFSHALNWTEVCSFGLGCWRNGFKRPVLKHGPRSLTCMRVFGWQTLMRNESEKVGFLWMHHRPRQIITISAWVWAYMLGPERWWTIPE